MKVFNYGVSLQAENPGITNFSYENQRKYDRRIYIEKRRSGTKWLSAIFDAFSSYNFSHAMQQMQYPVMFLLLCSLTA